MPLARLRAVLDDIFAGLPEDVAPEEFLRWVVAEWRGAVRRALSWMERFPPMPNLRAVARNTEEVVAAYRGGRNGGGFNKWAALRGKKDRQHTRDRWRGKRAQDTEETT